MRLAIDPGNDTGWALFEDDGRLYRCGLGTPPPPTIHLSLVVIERPQVYAQRHSRVDPNDLITLAIGVGRYAERYESKGISVDFILPRVWKGTVNPDVLCARVEASLLPSEREIFAASTAKLAQGKKHNVFDAIGLGKWSIKRGRAATF